MAQSDVRELRDAITRAIGSSLSNEELVINLVSIAQRYAERKVWKAMTPKEDQ